MNLPILKLDNVEYHDQLAKISEECDEVMLAETRDERIAECIDLIQATFGFINMMLHQEDIKEAFRRHNDKLTARKWETEGYIKLTFRYK